MESGTLHFAIVRNVDSCVSTYSGSINLDGKIGAGTYTVSNCRGQTQKGAVSIVQLSQAGKPEAAESPSLDCLVKHKQEGYWTWRCDEEGKEYSDRVSLLSNAEEPFRTKHLTTEVWSGPLDELTETSEDLIEAHQQESSRCKSYFHLAYVSGNGDVRWNWLSKNMLNWWKDEGKKRFQSLCAVRKPSDADYVVTYSDATTSVPYSFSIPVRKSTYVTGNVRGFVGGQYTYGTYSGYAYSTENQTHSGSWRQLHVWAQLFLVGSKDSGIIYETKHIGRTRWSKPDKDCLVDALKFMEAEGIRRQLGHGGKALLYKLVDKKGGAGPTQPCTR